MLQDLFANSRQHRRRYFPERACKEKVKKEDLARQIAERDHIEEGLICVLSVLEPCRTFSFRTEKGKPFVASARRKCLFLYYYFMNRDFGLLGFLFRYRCTSMDTNGWRGS